MRRASEAEAAPAPLKAARTNALTSPSSLNPAPPFPLAQLHRDLLGVVLSHLPQRYRLRVASRVCKHWRRLILGTIRTLKLALAPGVMKNLALYPALASLVCWPCRDQSLSETDLVTSFPTTLMSLRLDHSASWTAKEISIMQLTHLTARGMPNQWQTLVGPSCATLQSLELLLFSPFAPVPRLPRLTRLAVLDCSDAVFVIAINDLGTQLRALSLGGPEYPVPEHFFVVLKCPALTALACYTRSLQHVASSLLRLQQQSPSLTDLMVACNDADVPVAQLSVLPALATLLSRLEFNVSHSPSSYGDVLPKLTHLKHLALTVNSVVLSTYSNWPPPVLAALRTVAVYNTRPAPWDFLAKCTNITELRIGGALSDAVETNVLLPSLRKLHISHESWEQMLDVVSKFRPFAPSLTKVSMRSHSIPTFELVTHMCHACNAMGLSALHLTALPPRQFAQSFPAEVREFAATFSPLEVKLTTRPKRQRAKFPS